MATSPVLISVVESPTHPAFQSLYRRLGLEEIRVESQRKAIALVKKHRPAFVVAEFFYTFNTYYQAINISNLDVLLNSLVKYSPETRVIALVSKEDRPHVDELDTSLPLHACLVHPVSEAAMEEALSQNGNA